LPVVFTVSRRGVFGVHYGCFFSGVIQVKRFTQWFFITCIVAVTVVAPVSAEQHRQLDAHQTVQHTTEQVMAVIDRAQDYFEQDPERFYAEIEAVLGEVIDFDGFARGVMGYYGSKKAYMTLQSADERELFKQRIRRFSDTFREGLVQTYAKGLLAFGGTRIEIVPPENLSPAATSVTVAQKIYGEAEQPYTVLYKMQMDRSGAWKLRNVTIEAVNLGKVYQGQFASAVRQYEGDVDKVIDTWSVAPGAAAESETAAVADADEDAAL
jgi:phospholipid transport system substrate-binding protein